VSILDRGGNRSKKTVTISARIPEDLAEEFKAWCEKFDWNISEAIYEIIKREVEELRSKYGDIMKNKEKNVNENEDNHHNETYTKNNDDNNEDRKRYVNIHRGRPPKGASVKEFEVDGEVPCPKCEAWISYSNFARHCKTQHDQIPSVLFSFPFYREIAERMKTERLQQKQQAENEQPEGGA